eukprot:7130232-Alexandrium_andersonii.AAC.1
MGSGVPWPWRWTKEGAHPGGRSGALLSWGRPPHGQSVLRRAIPDGRRPPRRASHGQAAAPNWARKGG